jgi:dTDP-4-dehydrorhamnose reductase
MNRPVVIFGARGMLGSDIVSLCTRRGIEVRGCDLPEVDICNAAAVREAIRGADAVINCAAYTDVEKAESQQDRAFAVNAKAVGQLGQIARQAGAWVLHFGTDFVFDGRLERPYRESDATNPLSIYGKSKLAGEEELTQSGCGACVLRIEWTYGTNGNNFVRKVLAAAQSGKELRIVDDQVGSPTATTEVAAIAVELLEKRPLGLYHFANAGYASRFETAQFILKNKGINTGITSCKSSEFKTAAVRPLNSRFDCGKITAMLGRSIEHWQVPLSKYLEGL